MKLEKIFKHLEIEENLPSDVKGLLQSTYTSESTKKDIKLQEMDLIHFLRTFIKLQNQNETLKKRITSFYESQIPSTVPTATFNYIPNNLEGQKLVYGMKRYLNKERYTLKDRGQCINREKYSLEEVSTDRGIDKKEYGKFLKVHINEKRRSK